MAEAAWTDVGSSAVTPHCESKAAEEDSSILERGCQCWCDGGHLVRTHTGGDPPLLFALTGHCTSPLVQNLGFEAFEDLFFLF